MPSPCVCRYFAPALKHWQINRRWFADDHPLRQPAKHVEAMSRNNQNKQCPETADWSKSGYRVSCAPGRMRRAGSSQVVTLDASRAAPRGGSLARSKRTIVHPVHDVHPDLNDATGVDSLRCNEIVEGEVPAELSRKTTVAHWTSNVGTIIKREHACVHVPRECSASLAVYT